MRRTLNVLIFLFSTISGFSHQLIKGKVTDSNSGLPLKGVNVFHPGSGVGTNTDAFGNYTIAFKSDVDTLVFSFIGYGEQRIGLLNGQEIVDVNLISKNFELPQVTIQGGNNGQSLVSIPSVDLKLRPVNSSQDALRVVPGLFIGQHAGGGKAEQIFMRGFDIDHGTDINITVDGMPVNMVSHAHGQGYADLHFLIPETIDEIDWGKGPYRVDKGNFATAGYVDFNTKGSLDKSMVKIEGGQFNTRRIVGLVNVLPPISLENKTSAYVATEFFGNHGPFESPQLFTRLNLFGKLTAYLDNGSKLSIQASNFSSKWNASGQIPQRAVDAGLIGRFGAIDNTEGGNTSRTNIIANLNKRIDENSSAEHLVYFTRYNFELYSNFTFFLNDSVNGDQIKQRENRSIIGYQSSYNRRIYLVDHVQLESRVGIGFRYDNVNDNELSHTLNRDSILNRVSFGDVDETNLFGFIDETVYLGRLSINGALRVDVFSFDYHDKLSTTFRGLTSQSTILSPKLNFSYRLTDRINIYFNNGVGFHSNDARVVTGGFKNALPGGFGQDLGVLYKPTSRILLQAALWRLNLEQEFVYVGDEGVVEPNGKTTRKGIDFSGRFQLLKGLFADFDLNLTKPRAVAEAEGQNYIPLAPIITSIGGLSVKTKNGFWASLRYRYMANRPANADNSIVAKGYQVFDATLSYTHHRFEMGLSCENLLNTAWNETQFSTESRLKNEPAPIEEIHFTPGIPRFIKGRVVFYF